MLPQVVAQYSAAEVVWVQEEPKNMGAWLYVKPRLDTSMRELFGEQVCLPHTLSRQPRALSFSRNLVCRSPTCGGHKDSGLEARVLPLVSDAS